MTATSYPEPMTAPRSPKWPKWKYALTFCLSWGWCTAAFWAAALLHGAGVPLAVLLSVFVLPGIVWIAWRLRARTKRVAAV